MREFTNSGDAELVDCRIGRFLTFTGDLITEQLQEFGAHTRNELALVLAHVRSGDTIVDIGAHIGTYAIPLARRVGPTGRVLAIEADPRTYQFLTWNVGLNGLTTTIQTQRRILWSGSEGRFARVDVSGNTGAGFFEPANGVDAQEPATDALACLCAAGFSSPDLIKIDVEGMELGVLRSLRPILACDRPVVYIEISAPQLARWGTSVEQIGELLRPLGYRFFRNVGERNSSNDRYEMRELPEISHGGKFFDLLALANI